MKKRLRIFLFAGGVCALLGAIALALFVLYLSRNLPSVEELQSHHIAQPTKIYARDGKTLLYEISSGERRTVIPFDQIPQALKDATIAIEDERFYETPAFDWRGYLRALVVNIRNRGIVQGGSTITIQLARNAFLSTEQTITRKLKELLLAIRLNREYSKDEILALYLNGIPYGLSAYGVEATSRIYFNKGVHELSVAESALLAALPKAPSKYSPWGNYKDALIERQRLILKKMHSLEKLSDEDFDRALRTPLVFAQERTQSLQAPHFVIEVQEYLIDKYGDETVRGGGLRVVTTLDRPLQEAAQKIIADGVADNERLYGGTNGALVAEDPRTGQILALVGSRNYFDVAREGNFNVVTQGRRQPGSALKPFVYLAAFEKGYTPDTVLFDVPTEFGTQNPPCTPQINPKNNDGACFHPENFDLAFRGPVSMRRALAQSINIPAVKALYLVGLNDTIKRMNDFGLETLDDPRRYGLSLVLGGGEVRLIDLVKAYSVLAADGVKRDQTFILEIRDKNGRVLESFKDTASSIIDPHYVRLLNDILSDTNARSGLFTSSLPLTIFPDHDVALKTGTSNDYRDAWALGYTPSLVVGVWAGNNNNAPMHQQGSSILAAIPIWSKFMRVALASTTPEGFARPEARPAPEKPILQGNYTAHNHVHTILYYVDRNSPTSDMPNNPQNDPQFINWETGVLTWASNNIPNFSSFNQGVFPNTTQKTSPIITLTAPAPGVFVGDQVVVAGTATGERGLRRIVVYANNQVIKELQGDFGPRHDFSFSIQTQSFSPQNSIVVEAIDAANERGEARMVVYK